MRGIITVAIALAASMAMLTSAWAADSPDAPVATVGSETIKHSELEAHVKPKLIEIESEKYEALKEGLDEMISDALMKLEGKSKNMTPEALEKAEVDDKVPALTDAEIQKVCDDNKAQLGGQTLEQIKPRIVEYLK